MKRFLLILISLSCVCGCSLDKARQGSMCPPADASNPNAKAYIFQNQTPVESTNIWCPDKEPSCYEFTPDHWLRGNYYCHETCTGAQKDCNGECKSGDCKAPDNYRCPEACLNSCNTDGKCPCVNCDKGCDNNGNCCLIGPDVDGTCKKIEGCVNGHNPDGSCACSNCDSECDKKGNCCIDGLDNDGTCKKKEDCVNNLHNADGSCACVNCDSECDKKGNCCIDGLDNDGSCKKIEGCVNNLHNADGSCACSNCDTECDKKGNCCIDGLDDGSCKKKEGCVNSRHNADGSCECSNCETGCNDRGVCCIIEPNNGTCLSKAGCMNGNNEDGSCTSKDGCVNGNNDDGSCTCTENCQDTCEPNGACIDKNHNHMIDSYEIARGQDQDCTQNSDCDSDNNSGDGFCDNYMGYKCSTKCKNNSECIGNDGNFNYVCRSDGRCAPDEFTTVWELPIEDDNVEPNTIKLHFDENAKCQMQIDWGDNKIEELTCSEVIEHKYSQEYATGTITVKIKKRSGDMTGFHVENLSVEGETKQKFCKLKKILSFGDIGLGTNAFIDCYLLDELPSVDIPNPQNLTTMERMFKNNCSLNYPLNNWDVSNVTTMNKTFWMPNCPGADNEDERISTVSSTFNQQLDRWNVSKVTIMTNMFGFLPEFNQPLDVWNVSNVTNMDGMFAGAIKFNQPLNQWDVSKVTSMEAMFYKAKKFNQELSKWNVKKVKNFKNMFQYADSFDQDLSSWKVNKEANVDGIFDGAPMSDAHLCAIVKAYYDNTFLWGTSEYWPVSFLKKLFEDYNGCPN